ncbi:MAG: hypothetical protein LRY51_16735, partial [Geovibrio sp.]|nr:hypothetical protein [Geovibrio sp.]
AVKIKTAFFPVILNAVKNLLCLIRLRLFARAQSDAWGGDKNDFDFLMDGSAPCVAKVCIPMPNIVQQFIISIKSPSILL